MQKQLNLRGSTWTIFGLGHFFFEVNELITLCGGKVIQVVVNQPIPPEIAKTIPDGISITPLAEFSPRSDHYAFGFTSPQKEVFLKLLAQNNLSFPNLIHPSTVLPSSVQLGIGNLIQPGVVIGTRSILGDFNVLNRCSSLGHGVILGNCNHLGPRAVVCGLVTMGDKIFVGAGGIVIDRIRICDGCTIGAGAVVNKDLVKPGTYVGIPAKLITAATQKK